MTNIIKEFTPKSDRKSFYGKCKAYELDNGCKLLKSYDTLVCLLDRDNTLHRLWGGYSATTSRHVHQFCLTYGLNSGGKPIWDKLEVERVSDYVGDTLDYLLSDDLKFTVNLGLKY